MWLNSSIICASDDDDDDVCSCSRNGNKWGGEREKKFLGWSELVYRILWIQIEGSDNWGMNAAFGYREVEDVIGKLEIPCMTENGGK